MRRHSARRDRWRSALPASSGGVNLISMMDILTVLLLFLLKSYVAGGEVMVPPPGIRLPASTADQPPQSSLVVAIDGDEVLLGSERVVSIADVLAAPSLEIESLSARLQEVQRQRLDIARLRGEQEGAKPSATIQGDREVEFQVLQRVMYTLNRNGYGSIALAVIQRS